MTLLYQIRSKLFLPHLGRFSPLFNLSWRGLTITPVSLDITQVSLNNAPVTLFTVRFQRWKQKHHSVKKTMPCTLHFTLSVHYAD